MTRMTECDRFQDLVAEVANPRPCSCDEHTWLVGSVLEATSASRVREFYERGPAIWAALSRRP